MHNFQQRKKIRRALSSRWAFSVLLIVTILLVKGAWGVYRKMNESSESLVKVHESLQKTGERKGELSHAIDTLKTPEGIEREIRGKFNVAKVGEEVIMIVDEKKLEMNDETYSIPWYRRIGLFFSNLF